MFRQLKGHTSSSTSVSQTSLVNLQSQDSPDESTMSVAPYQPPHAIQIADDGVSEVHDASQPMPPRPLASSLRQTGDGSGPKGKKPLSVRFSPDIPSEATMEAQRRAVRAAKTRRVTICARICIVCGTILALFLGFLIFASAFSEQDKIAVYVTT